MIAKRVFSEFLEKEINEDGGKQIPLHAERNSARDGVH